MIPRCASRAVAFEGVAAATGRLGAIGQGICACHQLRPAARFCIQGHADTRANGQRQVPNTHRLAGRCYNLIGNDSRNLDVRPSSIPDHRYRRFASILPAAVYYMPAFAGALEDPEILTGRSRLRVLQAMPNHRLFGDGASGGRRRMAAYSRPQIPIAH